MRTTFSLLLLSIAISAADASELDSRVKSVDREVVAQLGLGLASIVALIDAGDSSYQPRWALDQNGRYRVYKKLEAAGYLVIKSVRGLPDGSIPNEEFIVVRHTAKGAELARAILEQK